jgi:RNA polymerase sigma factor (sigma-70 family)
VAAREAELDAWMNRLAGGDRTAVDPLYAALRPRARALAGRRLPRPLADDVAQSALLRVFARASEFTPGRPCLPWFYAIVANEIRSAHRQETRSLPMEISPDAIVDAHDAEAQMVEREADRALELAIESLDGDSARAIAALLGRAPPPDVAPATLRKRVSRAYVKLRLLLGGHDAT